MLPEAIRKHYPANTVVDITTYDDGNMFTIEDVSGISLWIKDNDKVWFEESWKSKIKIQ